MAYKHSEIFQIIGDFGNFGWAWQQKFKNLRRKFSFLEIVKMKLENPIYESDPYLADFKPDLDRRHEKMAKTISSIEGKILLNLKLSEFTKNR